MTTNLLEITKEIESELSQLKEARQHIKEVKEIGFGITKKFEDLARAYDSEFKAVDKTIKDQYKKNQDIIFQKFQDLSNDYQTIGNKLNPIVDKFNNIKDLFQEMERSIGTIDFPVRFNNLEKTFQNEVSKISGATIQFSEAASKISHLSELSKYLLNLVSEVNSNISKLNQDLTSSIVPSVENNANKVIYTLKIELKHVHENIDFSRKSIQEDGIQNFNRVINKLQENKQYFIDKISEIEKTKNVLIIEFEKKINSAVNIIEKYLKVAEIRITESFVAEIKFNRTLLDKVIDQNLKQGKKINLILAFCSTSLIIGLIFAIYYLLK